MGQCPNSGSLLRALPKCMPYVTDAVACLSPTPKPPEAVSLPLLPSSVSFSQPGALTLEVLELGVGGGRDTGEEKNTL